MTEILPVQAMPNIKARDPAMWQAAQKLEASFLSEMLKHAGFDQMSETFGGGHGESQFLSMLRDHQAEALADNGGIGLAQTFYEAMVFSVERTAE